MSELVVERKRGNTYADVFMIMRKSSRTPLTITDCTFRLAVDPRPSPPDDSTQLFELEGTIVDGAGGLVSFAPDATEADHVGVFYFDIEMTDDDGRTRTVAEGRYIFKETITKAAPAPAPEAS